MLSIVSIEPIKVQNEVSTQVLVLKLKSFVIYGANYQFQQHQRVLRDPCFSLQGFHFPRIFLSPNIREMRELLYYPILYPFFSWAVLLGQTWLC